MSKGKVNERVIAKMLEQWWRELEPNASFIRTPQSGGWGTAETREIFRASGDVMTTSKTFPYSVEVKRRERWDETNLLKGRKSPVWDWWHQSCTQAIEMKVEPMMFFRRNRKPWWIMMSQTEFSRLQWFESFPAVVVFDFEVIEKRLQDGDWIPVVVEADDFFERVRPRYCISVVE